MKNPILDILIPRFVTDYCYMDVSEDVAEIICRVEDMEEEEISHLDRTDPQEPVIYVFESLNLFGFGLFPSFKRCYTWEEYKKKKQDH